MKIDFIGIGAQKAGTTWLATQLKRHPQIYMPRGELHFWDKPRESYDPAVWFSNFPDETKLNGEITPAYSFLPCSQIENIYAAVPNARLFLSLRNPIDRAWSHALMRVRRHSMIFEDISDDWFVSHFRSDQSRFRGDYLSHINNWSKVFGRDALHLILFDEIEHSPRNVMIELSQHIGASPEFFHQIDGSLLKEKVFAGLGYPLKPDLRSILQEMYYDDICSLNDLVDFDVNHWIS